MKRLSIFTSAVASIATAVLLTGAAFASEEDWSGYDSGSSSYHRSWADYYQEQREYNDSLGHPEWDDYYEQGRVTEQWNADWYGNDSSGYGSYGEDE